MKFRLLAKKNVNNSAATENRIDSTLSLGSKIVLYGENFTLFSECDSSIQKWRDMEYLLVFTCNIN
jgi:hypothetical protein